MVATSHPLAAQIGLEVLKRGGNAVDAAIATNAAMGLMEPTSNGIGGDLYAIVWDAKSQKLYGLNASGRAPGKATLAYFAEKGLKQIPTNGPVGEHAGPAGQMVERVEGRGSLALEGAVGERQRLAGVGLNVVHRRVEPRLARDPPRVRETGLLAVDARELASRLARELQPGAAGAARDVEQADARRELQLGREAGELGARLPVVLPEILANSSRRISA